MKIFLDDIRNPKDCVSYMYYRIGKLNPIYLENWEIVRNYNQFKNIIINNYNKITYISFDHDLADFHYEYSNEYYDKLSDNQKIDLFGSIEKDGYDCAKFLKEYYNIKNKELPIILIHSMNLIGKERIENLFK